MAAIKQSNGPSPLRAAEHTCYGTSRFGCAMSLQPHMTLPDNPGPLVDLGGDPLRKMRGRAGHRLEAEAEQAVLEFGGRDDRSDRPLQEINDLRRRAGRRNE